MSKSVNALLLETRDTDPDVRFMALNDLDTQLATEAQASRFTRQQRANYASTLLRTIKDGADEVRVQTLKCLPNLAMFCTDDCVLVVKELLGEIECDKSVVITSSIYTIAVHNVLRTLGPMSAQTATQLAQLVFCSVEGANATFLTRIDYVELAADLVDHLGSYLHADQVAQLAEWLVNGALRGENIISKRCVGVLRSLMEYTNESMRGVLFAQITNGEILQRKPLVGVKLCRALLEGSPKAMGAYADTLVGLIGAFLGGDVHDDFDIQLAKDEVKVEALELWGQIAALTETTGMGTEAWELLPGTLSYDPYGGNDDASEEENEDEDDDGYSDYSIESDDQETDYGASSKVRAVATKTVATIVVAHPLILPQVLSDMLQPLMSQLQVDKNRTVVMALVETITTLLGVAAPQGPYYGYRSFTEGQRRRSDVTMREGMDPLEFLHEHAGYLCETICTRVLTLPASNESMPAHYALVGQLSTTLGGINPAYLERLIFGLDTQFSVLGVNPYASRFYSAILDHNPLQSFGSAFAILLKFFQQVLNGSTNHKSSMEALQLTKDLFSVYVPRDSPESTMVSQLVDAVGETLINKTANRDLGIDIRKASLTAVSSMVCVAPASKSLADAFLLLLKQVISTDMLVQMGLNCLCQVLLAGKLQAQITPEWTDSILLTVVEYINVQELTILALKTLNTMYALGVVSEVTQKHIFNVLLETGTTVFSEDCSDQFGLLLFNSMDTSCAGEIVSEILKLNKFDTFTDKHLYKITEKLARDVDGQKLGELVLLRGSITDPSVAKFAATLCVVTNNSALLQSTMDKLQSGVEVYSSLVFINEVCKYTDLQSPLDVYLRFFEDPDDAVSAVAIKVTAAVVTRNPGQLGALLGVLSTEHSAAVLKALIQVTKAKNLDKSVCDAIMVSIMELLRAEAGDLDTLKEIHVSICAQCIAQLIAHCPEYLQQHIIPPLKKDISLWSSMDVTLAAVIRYVFSASSLDANAIYSEDLGRLLPLTTISLIPHENLIVKTIGIGNLNVVLTRSPPMAMPIFMQLLPIIMEAEIKVNKTFVRIQHIGPFKNRIDDGLNYRKQVFESIYYVCKAMEDTPAYLDAWNIPWSQHFNRLYDVSVKDDISIASVGLLTLSKIVELDRLCLSNDNAVQLLIDRSRKVINKKLVDTAVKQDLEKQLNLVMLVNRFLLKLDTHIEAGELVVTGSQHALWSNFAQEQRHFDVAAS